VVVVDSAPYGRPMEQIEQENRSPWWQFLLFGAILGAVVGALIGFATAPEPGPEDFLAPPPELVALAFGIIGCPVGAALGLFASCFWRD
jgi:hypothetical protein